MPGLFAAHVAARGSQLPADRGHAVLGARAAALIGRPHVALVKRHAIRRGENRAQLSRATNCRGRGHEIAQNVSHPKARIEALAPGVAWLEVTVEPEQQLSVPGPLCDTVLARTR